MDLLIYVLSSCIRPQLVSNLGDGLQAGRRNTRQSTKLQGDIMQGEHAYTCTCILPPHNPLPKFETTRSLTSIISLFSL